MGASIVNFSKMSRHPCERWTLALPSHQISLAARSLIATSRWCNGPYWRASFLVPLTFLRPYFLVTSMQLPETYQFRSRITIVTSKSWAQNVESQVIKTCNENIIRLLLSSNQTSLRILKPPRLSEFCDTLNRTKAGESSIDSVVRSLRIRMWIWE